MISLSQEQRHVHLNWCMQRGRRRNLDAGNWRSGFQFQLVPPPWVLRHSASPSVFSFWSKSHMLAYNDFWGPWVVNIAPSEPQKSFGSFMWLKIMKFTKLSKVLTFLIWPFNYLHSKSNYLREKLILGRGEQIIFECTCCSAVTLSKHLFSIKDAAHLYHFFFNSTYKWYHMIFVFLCLTYFT